MAKGTELADLVEALGIAPELAGSMVGSLAAQAGVEFGQSFHRSKTAEARFVLMDATASAEAVRRAGTAIGSILAEESEPSKGIVLLAVRTRAGWLQANPAILLAAIGGDTITIVATAKEGWIDQKTATGAIRRFRAALVHETTFMDEDFRGS